MRCFIAINLPTEIKEKIFHSSNLLHKKNLFKGKITEKENLHLTLKFLDEISEEKLNQVIESLKKLKFNKITAKIGESGVFNENLIKIVWLRVLGVEDLQKAIDTALSGLFPKESRFMSHLTIARVKFCKEKEKLLEEIKKIKIQEEFPILSFEIIKSELFPDGPRYKILEKFKLE